MPLEQLGFLSFLSLVWVVKFLWAPSVDRYVTKCGGDYKRFLIFVQILLICAIGLVSVFDVVEDKIIIILSLILVGLLSATQDIGTEGLAYKILLKNERGFGGTLKTIGGIVGQIVGVGIALAVYEQYGWSFTVLLLALVSAVTLVQLYFYVEHKVCVLHETTDITWRVITGFWQTKKRKKWLLLLVLYPLGMAMSYAMISPLLVDVGWKLSEIGFLQGVIGSIIGIISAIISGWLVKKYSRKAVLVGISAFEAIGISSLLFIVNGYDGFIFGSLAVSVILISYGASMPLISALIMDQISTKSPASEYALQFSIYMSAMIVSSAAGVSLAGVFGYAPMIITASMLSLITMIYAWIFYEEIENERDKTVSFN